MKLLIVGGCGQQVQPAINYLLEQDTFSTIVIGDINFDAAKQLVEERNNSKLIARHIDALNYEQLVDEMSDVDVVYNASGPYYLLGLKVLEAAIEAGKHYVDFCDDAEPTLEMIKLSDKAAAAGITAIVGLGATPGYSNLLAMQGVAQLDKTEEVNICWHSSMHEPSGIASLEHMFHIMSGDVIQFLDGESELVPALSEMELAEQFDTPERVMYSAFVGHPEPATLPNYITGVEQVTCRYTDTMEMLGLFLGVQQIGFLSNEPVALKGGAVSPASLLAVMLNNIPHEEVPEDEKFGFGIDVIGQKDDEDVTIRYDVKAVADLTALTSMPAALGAELLARGDITRLGVFPPEGCVEPKSIIEPMNSMKLLNLSVEKI